MKLLYYHLILALAVAEVVLVLLSWLLSATQTEGVTSLLSSEGLRWFFGSFVSMLVSKWLVWLLLLSMAGGCLWQSGLLKVSLNGYRERIAFRTTLILFLIYVLVIVALTAVPHAQLLSATGRLFPSPFSRALVPVVAFGLLLHSAVYGWASGRFTSFADVIDSMSYGLQKAAPLFILYIFFFQFFESLCFVFS